MIQVNLLLPIRGKAADSYVVMDLMRLPLGILSGMGFIGAGAILRKDNVVLGVTTAATLWFVTVLGLCFGGGQIELGCAALGLGLIVLWALKPVEKLWKHQRQGTLTVVVGNAGPTEQEITESLINGGYHVYSSSTVYDTAPASREMQYVVRWRNHGGEAHTPAFVAELAKNPHTLKVAWQRLRQ
jgi:putative Mg2+ transporter-C (MgtC) family protein